MQLGTGLRRNDESNQVAADFEALVVAQLLKAARAAQLYDDPLAGDAGFAELQDQWRARAIAVQSPLGVAKLLK